MTLHEIFNMKCPYTTTKQLIRYIRDVLSTPSVEYGGMPPCPFVKSELNSRKLMFAELDIERENLVSIIQDFTKSSYKSLLVVQKFTNSDSLSANETKQYQQYINKLLKKLQLTEYKCICFNPNDNITVRQQSPYFLINIAERKLLAKAHSKLMKTEYFSVMSEEYLKYLHVDPKKVIRKVGN